MNFDNLFYQSPQPMLIFDIDNLRILEVNDAAISSYGYNREEFLSLTTRDLRISEEKNYFDSLIPLFKGSENVYAEGQHLLKSGKVISVQIVSYIIEYKQKRCRLAHIHDVTSVVKQARDLEILVSIGKSISEDLDVRFIIQKVADATKQISGAEYGILFYSSSEGDIEDMLYATSTNSETILSKAGDLTRFKSFITDKVIRSEDIIKDRGTRGRSWINFNLPANSFLSVPIISKHKQVMGCLMLGHTVPDVFTESIEKMVMGIVTQATVALDNALLVKALIHANQEKESLLQKATEQNFKKDEFLSVASHELKTPVTSMKGYLQILEKQVSKEENSKYLNLIHKANKQVNKIVYLVSDLLNLSKLESGKLEYNFSDFKISDVINDSILNIKNSEVTHTVRVFGDKDCVIYGDKNRIEQVIINLIDNAIKYSPDANEVLIGLSQDRGYFKMEVRDFGPGIPEEKLHLIFERYYRGEENSFKTSGLGLGLFISSEIIKRHHGRIGVESEHGKGSTFWFVIPIEKEEN